MKPKKDNTFISAHEAYYTDELPTTMGYKTKNYLNSKFPRLMWKIQNKIIAPVKNHKDYIRVRNFIIDFVSTALLLIFVIWAFSIPNPIRKGFGVAVIIVLTQYYLEWYFGVKK